MTAIADDRAVRDAIRALPVRTYPAGMTLLSAGKTTGQLLILRQGTVEIARDGLRIGEVSEPGTVLGELALLLDRPHTADVRALEPTEVHVGTGEAFLREGPAAALYVATGLADRIATANRLLMELRHESAADATQRGPLGALRDVVRSLQYDHEGGVVPWYGTIPDRLLAPINRLPTERFAAGETILAEGSRTDRIWILKQGEVDVLSRGQALASLVVRGALIGEFSALLDRPHQADVRARKPTTLWVADSRAFLAGEPAAALYLATALARRLDAANGGLLRLRDWLPQAALAEGGEGGLLGRIQRLLAVGS